MKDQRLAASESRCRKTLRQDSKENRLDRMAADGSAARNMLHENALRRKSSAINHLAKKARVPSDVRRAGPSCESRPRRPAILRSGNSREGCPP